MIAQLRTRRRLVDLVLYEDEARRNLKVFALYVKYQLCSATGHQFLVYDVSYDEASQDRLIDEISDTVTLPALFCELSQVPGNGLLLIGSPYLERQLYAFRLQREFTVPTLTDAAFTGHHVRLARVFADRRWIVTCAYDGLVVVRDRTIRQIVAAVPAHHRLDSGSRRAIIDHDGGIVIAIGQDGSLIAVRIHRKNNKKVYN